MSGHNQFALLRQRRFLPFFVVQALGAFNDNVYRQAIISMLLFMAVPEEELGLYATLAPAIFILPYFLFSALAGQIADGVLGRFPAVKRVRVRVRKPDVVLDPPVDYAAVVVECTRV